MGERSKKLRVFILSVLIALIAGLVLAYRNIPNGAPAVVSFFLERAGGKLGDCSISSSSLGTFEVSECEIRFASKRGDTRISMTNGKFVVSSIGSFSSISAQRVEVDLPAASTESDESAGGKPLPSFPFARLDVGEAVIRLPNKLDIGLTALTAEKNGEAFKFQSQINARNISAAPGVEFKSVTVSGILTPDRISADLVSAAPEIVET